jgi:hypothetical protein
MSSTSSSSSNEDTNIPDNSTNAQQDSGQTTTAGQGYNTVNSKAKPRKQHQQRQEKEQPANQE